MPIAIIAAVARNRVIGLNGRLPWHIPEDLARFRRLTMGHTLLMGRRTYEAIGRPLDGRRVLVLSSRPVPGVETFTSPASALSALNADELLFITGGVLLFKEFLERSDLLHLTRIDAEPEGDTRFPPYEHLLGTHFRLTAREAHPGFTFEDYTAARPDGPGNPC
jgi:dihydrofolate reductase